MNIISDRDRRRQGGAGIRYKLRGPGSRERGPTRRTCFVFLGSITVCRFYKLTLSNQAQAIVQFTVGSGHICCFFFFFTHQFKFHVKIFNRFALPVGPENFFFHRSPNPLSVVRMPSQQYAASLCHSQNLNDMPSIISFI